MMRFMPLAMGLMPGPGESLAFAELSRVRNGLPPEDEGSAMERMIPTSGFSFISFLLGSRSTISVSTFQPSAGGAPGEVQARAGRPISFILSMRLLVMSVWRSFSFSFLSSSSPSIILRSGPLGRPPSLSFLAAATAAGSTFTGIT